MVDLWPFNCYDSFCVFIVDDITSFLTIVREIVFGLSQKREGEGGWRGESIPAGMAALKMAVDFS